MRYLIKDFGVSPGKFCISSSIQNILKYKNLDYAESDIFFMCNAMSYSYIAESPEKKFFGAFINDYMSSFTDTTGIESVFSYVLGKKRISQDDILEDMILQLKKDNPIIALIQTDRLKYDPIYHSNKKREHSIIIYGVDTAKNEIYIGDSFIIQYDGSSKIYQGVCDMADVLSGLIGYGWFITENVDQNSIEKQEPLENVKKNIQYYIESYGTDEYFYKGSAALRRFLMDNEEFISGSDDEMKKTCIDICYRIRYTSIISSIVFIIDFLETYQNSHLSNIDAYIPKLRDLKSSWKKMSSLILKVGISNARNSIQGVLRDCEDLLLKTNEIFRYFLESY